MEFLSLAPAHGWARKRGDSIKVSALCSYTIAAEQKARATYEHLMNMTDNAQILEPLYFLREREVVHFQRFGECLEIVQNLQGRQQRCCKCGRSRRR